MGEMNGKSANLNNCLSYLYPAGTTIPANELVCIFDADQVRHCWSSRISAASHVCQLPLSACCLAAVRPHVAQGWAVLAMHVSVPEMKAVARHLGWPKHCAEGFRG